MTKKQKKLLCRILSAAVLFLIAKLLPDFGSVGYFVKSALWLSAYLLVGYDVLRKAVLGLFGSNVFNENLLMTVATVGAIALEVVEGGSDFSEAVAVMLLYQIGELFQSIAVGKSRRSITSLMDIRPDVAHITSTDGTRTVSPEEVKPGDVIEVLPGEKIPLDGTVLSGTSVLDTSALTGESVPRTVRAGDDVVSGCINLSGVISVTVEKGYGQSTVSKILDLVENASSRKSKSEDFISKFAKYYTPAVVLSAVALAVLPPLVGLALGAGNTFSEWIYRALTFLVISCPCALVISVPLTFFAGLGGAGKEGILIKGSNFLETLSRVKTVVFDKTGTLTKGVFEVSELCPTGISDEEFLFYSAHAEIASPHPIAKSLSGAYGKPLSRADVHDVTEISGHGVCAVVKNKTVLLGNEKLMKERGVSCDKVTAVGTVVYMALDGKYAGYAVICDKIKEQSKSGMESLRALGIKKTVMLTGDRDAVARDVGEKLGVDAVVSELLPDGKVEVLEKLLLEQSPNEKLAFVGDGMNDAPVLSRADIGIAMGALGSDAAIESADVVLMDDNPKKISRAIFLSKKCIRIVYENIGFAILVKLSCLVLGALGITDMWAAIFADVGVMILAVLNAIRALKTK